MPAESPVDDMLLIPEREAARRLSLSSRTLFTLRRRGQIPFLKIGTKTLYDPHDLTEFIAAHRQTAGASEHVEVDANGMRQGATEKAPRLRTNARIETPAGNI
jgi:excisionase family DNA binding protein